MKQAQNRQVEYQEKEIKARKEDICCSLAAERRDE